jgi:tRNA(Ile)-lysidine synthetase-like protein
MSGRGAISNRVVASKNTFSDVPICGNRLTKRPPAEVIGHVNDDSKRHDGKRHDGPSSSSPYPVSRLAPVHDLVDIAREIETANTMISTVAGSKLQVIAEQIQALQAQARAARYAALRRLASERHAARVAVGHTRDDQAETVLARILRGAGVGGLAGIEPCRPDGVVRPLIECRREAVQAYAVRHFPDLAADPSNTDPRYLRTRVRSHILPVLSEEDPSIVEHLAQLADDARALQTFVEGAARALLADAEGLEPRLYAARMRTAPKAVRRSALRAWVWQVTGHRPGRVQLMAMDAALYRGGTVWLSGDWSLEASKESGVRLVQRGRTC